MEVRRHMPLVIHPRVRKTLGIAVATCAAMVATNSPAVAAPPSPARCSTPPLTTPFAAFGDTGGYFPAPGGTFQTPADAAGWTLQHAAVTPGAGGADGSLTIDGGGSATSPLFCLDSTMPSLRFLAQELSPGDDLKVQVVIQLGNAHIPLTIARLADGTMPELAPVTPIGLATHLLPRWASLQVALRFTVPAGAGRWQIGDVFIDPYRTS